MNKGVIQKEILKRYYIHILSENDIYFSKLPITIKLYYFIIIKPRRRNLLP